MAGYELWIDESGDFKDEALKKRNGQKGSLAGGILVRREMADRIPYSELLDPEKYHATELSALDKREYVLPMLEILQEKYEAREVFFENKEYESSLSNRKLYLRIIAEGLLQLMLRLNAVEEDIQLRVLIAQRQDMDAEPGGRRIEEKEYIGELQDRINRKKAERRLILNKNSSLSFNIDIANRTQKLQLADFACNTRLTRDSLAFRDIKSRLDRLYEKAYVFSLSELSENYIHMCLTQGMISDALLELYTAGERLNRAKIIDLIMDKLDNWSYRLVKSQLKQCAADMTALIAQEDDYEVGEEILENINRELIPGLCSFAGNIAEFQFAILLNLSDMYLREGDILNARRVLKECEAAHRRMGEQLEMLLSYYQLQEKLALYEIDSFQYENAMHRMGRVVESFENLIKLLEADPNLAGRFPHIESEYLGDAICMQLYAMMFLQRRRPTLYDEMCRLSDLAMEQYPAHEGELERHRQYRSRIELEHGKTETALAYLMQAKTYQSYKSLTKEDICEFLRSVAESEVAVSRRYYLMYYILIMKAAGDKKELLAEWMHEALLWENRLYAMLKLPEDGKTAETEDFQNKVSLRPVQEKATRILYHPMEIVYWKYGVCLHADGGPKKRRKARHYLRAAAEMCFRFPEYLTMEITGLGISAELIQVLLEDGKEKEAQRWKAELGKKIREIQNLVPDGETEAFIKTMKKHYDRGEYLKMADMIAY